MKRFLVFLALCASVVAAPEAGSHSLQIPFRVSDQIVADLTGDGAAEVVLAGRDGRVAVLARNPETGHPALGAGEALILPEPERSLLAVGRLHGADRPASLVVLSPRGIVIHGPAGEGGFAAAGTLVARRGKFTIRLGEPRFADLLTDLNADGFPDLLLPRHDSFEVWMHTGLGGEDDRPGFRRVATVHAQVDHQRNEGGDSLSSMLEETLTIPPLRFEDVSGDGRPDLVVEREEGREFFLQREDGTLPVEPDRTLDLSRYRDTTPSAAVRPGRVLAGADDATLTESDLDGDGLADYVITHRRKLWVYHGKIGGPDFSRPSEILKVAEDVSAVLVVDLDEDGHPDLLLLRIQVPSVASFLSSLVTALTIEISATAYANESGRSFSRLPTLKGAIEVRIPNVLGILRDPRDLIERFEAIGDRFRPAQEADLDGDGKADVAMISEDAGRVDLWRGQGDAPAEGDPLDLRGIFFDESEKTWTVDRILEWLGRLAEGRAARLTGGREPDRTVALRDPERFLRTAMLTADLDGDGREALLVFYRDPRHPDRGLLDVLRPW